MPRTSGLDLHSEIQSKTPSTQVVVMTAYSTTDTALDAMRRGAADYVVKPFKLDAVKVTLDKCLEKRSLIQENATLRKTLEDRGGARTLISRSPAMAKILDMIDRVAPTPTTVLVLGESGTGKELVARTIHLRSDRKGGPFVPINCGAIPETLIESELFGHQKGSFTGATRDKKGLFEAAEGGTIFLDEIYELPLQLQVKLLRALQERRVKPVGGNDEVRVDVRVIAATNRDLAREVGEGRFRADLYYRLNVIQLLLPPLRDRREDILPIAHHFLRDFTRSMSKAIRDLTPEAERTLLDYPYPGNIRELENIIERAVALETGDRITLESLPDPGSGSLIWGREAPTEASDVNVPPLERVERCARAIDAWALRHKDPLDLEEILATFEKALLAKVLKRTDGNKTEASRALGVTFRSLRYKLDKYGMDAPEAD